MIGRHLLFDGRAYRLEFTAAETKTGRLYHAAVPPELTAYVDDYLQVHRPRLQSFARADGPGTDGRLWLGRRGRPLSSGGIERLIAARTREAFGKPIYPHLFREIAVTELVDFAPDEIGIAPDLLGHADLRTTRKHYIQAQSMVAHLRVQDVIAARRRAAASRGSTGISRAEPRMAGVNHAVPLAEDSAGLDRPAARSLARFNRNSGDGRLELAAGPGS